MKIAIVGIGYESNSFSRVRGNLHNMRQVTWCEDPKEIEIKRGCLGYAKGMYDIAEQMGIDLIPTVEGLAAGPTMEDKSYLYIKNRMLSMIERVKDEIDGICLFLHGAMVSESDDDCETTILKELREMTKGTLPICVCSDLHGNISEETIGLVTTLVGCKEYPHDDMRAAGQKVMGLLVQCISGEINPVIRIKKLPFVVPHASGCTYEQPAKEIKEYVAAYEKEHGLLDCSWFHGFPLADVECMSSSIVVTSDGDEALALKSCQDIAEYIWHRRELFDSRHTSVKEGFEQALRGEGGPVIIGEFSDNPGGGCAGDATVVLKYMLDHDIKKACIDAIYDPEAVEIAVNAGVGSYIDISLGGKVEAVQGEPVEIKKAYVKCITDGKYIVASDMHKGNFVDRGKSVRLVVKDIDIIVCSGKRQTYDDQLLKLHGIDVMKYKIVVVKSSQHFKSYFQKIAKEIILVDYPGICPADISSLPYKKIKRPMYPIDK